MITVERATDGERWNRFIHEMKPDHFGFTWAWKEIIEHTFGHSAHYYVALRENEIDGVLPLFQVKSFLFGSALISIPYLNAGGILAKSPAAFEALLKKAHELKEELHVRYVEFRAREENNLYRNENGFPLSLRTHKVAMQLPLPDTEEKLFQSFDKKLRSQIRRPTKDGVTASTTSPSPVEEFYAVFSENMRDLGTPVYPKRLWEEIRRALPEATFIIASHQGKPIAAGVIIPFEGTIEIPWASSLRASNRLSPNMLLYWEALRSSVTKGCKTFDFGRSSRDSSTFRFKSQWGAQPKTLHWYYIGGATDVPDVNPKSRKFSLLVAIWRCLPLSLANRLGPIITKSLP